jgi:UDP-N-acetylglucosamine 2-epimerase (non-hydrolysing)
MKEKIALVFGTRPEIIKLSPIIRRLITQKLPFFLLHTGQHYSYGMDRLFFKELGLPEPKYQLEGRSRFTAFQAEHTGRMMAGIEKILLKERPDTVLVQGDTNSVLAGALAAAKIKGIRIGHVEAGLRSYDRQMPEEINRVLCDHLSDFLFTPTKFSKKILLGEGIPPRKIFVTGNTIVDAVKDHLCLAKKAGEISPPFGKLKNYFLMTLHRQENVDDRKRLSAILEGLKLVSDFFKTAIVFPIHPRTQKRLMEFGLSLPKGVEKITPVGFLQFLKWEDGARLILTDSGGVQEEACILGVPCVTIRDTTERPESVQAGANLIAGAEPQRILKGAQKMFSRKRNWKNPFGDGFASDRILRILKSR